MGLLPASITSRERLMFTEEVNQETEGDIRDDTRLSSRNGAGLDIEEVRQTYQQMGAPYNPSRLENEANAPTCESPFHPSQQLPLAQPAQEYGVSAYVPHSESFEEPSSPYVAYSVPQQQLNIFSNSPTHQTTPPQSRYVHACAPSFAPGTRNQVILQYEQALRDRGAESALHLSQLHLPPPYDYWHYMPPYSDLTQRLARGQSADQISQLCSSSEVFSRPDSRQTLHLTPFFFHPPVSPPRYSNHMSPHSTLTRYLALGRPMNQKSQLPPISERHRPSGTQSSHPAPSLRLCSPSQGPNPQAGTSRVSLGSETPLSHIDSRACRTPRMQRDHQQGMPRHSEHQSFPPNRNDEPLLDGETSTIPDSRSLHRLEEPGGNGDEDFGRGGAD